MATVKELLTNVANNTRKFLGTEEQLSLEEMSQGIGEASAESDFQTELIEEFSTILDRSVAPDAYANGKEDGYAEGVRLFQNFVEGSLNVLDSTALTKIRPYAFYQATLTSVNLPNVTSLGTGSFSGCAALTHLNIPNVVDVPDNAFYSCRTLTAIDFPKALNFGDKAFYACYGISQINAPLVENLGSNCFFNVTALKSVYLPSVKTVGAVAFDNCTALQEVILPNVVSISQEAFSECSVKELSFPELVTLGSKAFSECKSLTRVTFPKLSTADQYCLWACWNLNYADLGTVTRIATYAFAACFYLDTIILRSETVCTLNTVQAFNNCYRLLGTANSSYNPNGEFHGYVYVPRALVDVYPSETNWSALSLQYRALEDYTVDGTTTGALDPNKI